MTESFVTPLLDYLFTYLLFRRRETAPRMEKTKYLRWTSVSNHDPNILTRRL